MTWVFRVAWCGKKHQYFCTKVSNSAVENAWLVISWITNYYIAWRGSTMLNKELFIENENSSTEEGWVILQRGNISTLEHWKVKPTQGGKISLPKIRGPAKN